MSWDNGRLAQLVRALALQARGHRFESISPTIAEIAQLVGNWLVISRLRVQFLFSAPFFWGIAKWSNAADCKSVPSGSMVQIHVPPPLLFGYWMPRSQAVRHHTLTVALVSSNLAGATKFIIASLAQSVEHLTFNQRVWSSNLQRGTIYKI